MVTTKVALTLVLMIGCTVAANLLMKSGALFNVAQGVEATPLSTLLNWRILAGLASFGFAGLLYALVLHWLPLNVAQSFAAVQFVAVILGSAFVLDERIAPMQWLGISLIALGIAAVGWSRQ